MTVLASRVRQVGAGTLAYRTHGAAGPGDGAMRSLSGQAGEAGAEGDTGPRPAHLTITAWLMWIQAPPA